MKYKNNLDEQYNNLLYNIVENGNVKLDRTGVGTKSIFGESISHNMNEGFPLLTGKQVHFKSVIIELLWFLGKHMKDPTYKLLDRTNIKYLVDNNCNIWNGDAYKNYCKYTSANSVEWNQWMRTNNDGSLSMYTLEEFINCIKTDVNFAKRWGNLGPIYGQQWRSWNGGQIVLTNPDANHNIFGENLIDQIDNLIKDLKTNPDSRRLIVNSWNVGKLNEMILPPCHYSFQCYTRELTELERRQLYDKKHSIQTSDLKTTEHFDLDNIPKRALSLKWDQRSVDTPLGLPFNIASYGLLLSMLATLVNMVPDTLKGFLGDTHIYSNQLEFIDVQLQNETYDLPKLVIKAGSYKTVEDFEIDSFSIQNYKHSGKIPYPLSN